MHKEAPDLIAARTNCAGLLSAPHPTPIMGGVARPARRVFTDRPPRKTFGYLPAHPSGRPDAHPDARYASLFCTHTRSASYSVSQSVRQRPIRKPFEMNKRKAPKPIISRRRHCRNLIMEAICEIPEVYQFPLIPHVKLYHI